MYRQHLLQVCLLLLQVPNFQVFYIVYKLTESISPHNCDSYVMVLTKSYRQRKQLVFHDRLHTFTKNTPNNEEVIYQANLKTEILLQDPKKLKESATKLSLLFFHMTMT